MKKTTLIFALSFVLGIESILAEGQLFTEMPRMVSYTYRKSFDIDLPKFWVSFKRWELKSWIFQVSMAILQRA